VIQNESLKDLGEILNFKKLRDQFQKNEKYGHICNFQRREMINKHIS
jgi:hypothetical protein